MKVIDRMIFKELIGPWCFGVGMFTVLIMAGTFLFKITDYVVQGVPIGILIELTLLLLPGIMGLTFAMAVLLAALLSFGRLSGDSEIVALKASGCSVPRIMVPVGLFGAAVSFFYFGFNETLVPWAALRATAIQTQIAKTLNVQSTQTVAYPVFDKGKLTMLISAADFSIQASTMRGVNLIAYDKQGKQSLAMFAKEMYYAPSDQDWRIRGGATIISLDGQTVVEQEGDVWPGGVPKVAVTPENLIAQQLKDLDAMSMAAIRKQIEEGKETGAISKAQIANLEFGYYNKIALPLAAFIFGLLGAALGIRNHRTGTSTGFWIAVLVIFAYRMMANLMAIYAQGGVIPAWIASFAPVISGFVIACFLIWRKNL